MNGNWRQFKKVNVNVVVNGEFEERKFNNEQGVIVECLNKHILIQFPLYEWYFCDPHRNGDNYFIKPLVDDRKEFTDEEYEELLV